MNNCNGSSRRIAVPGEIRLAVVHQDNGMATAVPFPIQTPDGVQLLIFGGLTKLEEIASRVAGGMTDGRMIDPVDEDVVRIAKLSVRIAKAIIEESGMEAAGHRPISESPT